MTLHSARILVFNKVKNNKSSFFHCFLWEKIPCVLQNIWDIIQNSLFYNIQYDWFHIVIFTKGGSQWESSDKTIFNGLWNITYQYSDINLQALLLYVCLQLVKLNWSFMSRRCGIWTSNLLIDGLMIRPLHQCKHIMFPCLSTNQILLSK